MSDIKYFSDSFKLYDECKMNKVIVIGGGAAGLAAAYSASKNGKDVVLLEKNDKLGKKIYITGKGRCNLTNDVNETEFLENVVSNSKFLFSAIYALSPQKTIDFFERNGMPIRIERGKRVFPYSNKASDVTRTLEKVCISAGVDIRLNTEVKSILTENGKTLGVLLKNGKKVFADSVIIATGGISYPLTGSTGDGYLMTKQLGHKIVDLKPALVGLELDGVFYKDLQGLSLKNVRLTATYDNKKIFDEIGEMIFTHFGVSGPLVLSVSSLINRLNLIKVGLSVDLKPGLDYNLLEKKFIREFSENSSKTAANYLRGVLPHSLIEQVLFRAKISKEKKLSSISVEERKRLINVLKNFELKIKKLRPIEEAIVTAGGVCVKEINPKTMESKIISGLFFAGEVIDVDAFTGGFNIQIAFSTGYLAGLNS